MPLFALRLLTKGFAVTWAAVCVFMASAAISDERELGFV